MTPSEQEVVRLNHQLADLKAERFNDLLPWKICSGILLGLLLETVAFIFSHRVELGL